MGTVEDIMAKALAHTKPHSILAVEKDSDEALARAEEFSEDDDTLADVLDQSTRACEESAGLNQPW